MQRRRLHPPRRRVQSERTHPSQLQEVLPGETRQSSCRPKRPIPSHVEYRHINEHCQRLGGLINQKPKQVN